MKYLNVTTQTAQRLYSNAKAFYQGFMSGRFPTVFQAFLGVLMTVAVRIYDHQALRLRYWVSNTLADLAAASYPENHIIYDDFFVSDEFTNFYGNSEESTEQAPQTPESAEPTAEEPFESIESIVIELPPVIEELTELPQENALPKPEAAPEEPEELPKNIKRVRNKTTKQKTSKVTSDTSNAEIQ